MSNFTNGMQLVYVVAAACFVIGLHLMNSPATARRGNQVSTVGMVVAVVATLILLIHDGTVTGVGWAVIIVGAALGSAVGMYSARTVQMTAMAMPAVETWLPRRAVAGEFIRCRPTTKQAAART